MKFGHKKMLFSKVQMRIRKKTIDCSTRKTTTFHCSMHKYLQSYPIIALSGEFYLKTINKKSPLVYYILQMCTLLKLADTVLPIPYGIYL